MNATRIEGGWLCTWNHGTPFSPREVVVTDGEIEAALTHDQRYDRLKNRHWPRRQAARDAIAIGKHCGSYQP